MMQEVAKRRKPVFLYLTFLFTLFAFSIQASGLSIESTKIADGPNIVSARKINPTTVEILLKDSNRLSIDFYADGIFRMFQDNNGGIIRDPEAKPPAQILVDNAKKQLSKLTIEENAQQLIISTSQMKIEMDKRSLVIKVKDVLKDRMVAEFIKPAQFEDNKVTLTLKENENEYFYGGGVQNGRFSHKGKQIAIENQNSWTDGGVASPNPFYWSTRGYGIMWHTFKKGTYDFGATNRGEVILSHQTNYLDVFFMIGDGAKALLNQFYALTGNPVLIPKFGFYQGHLNAYNRDYWTESEDEKGVVFEDGKRYKESQKDNVGVKESLNGELNNYQFSARAVIDRYKDHDMPLGWILPNDGYGAGYGQTGSLDGNIQNLKKFGDYARKNGVEIGLWTQSDLHPKEGIAPLLQRDIVKEVRDAGVRVLKTDVAWVGAGYSFGLNGVADAGEIMPYYGSNARPFIISLDGWAGTQRYATIWSGDQTGGKWEYIRFHIPTYLGSGLSGNPNISSDMDGIFGGKNPAVNTRDWQWKTFTPMQLNMDGWGANEKYPHALGEPTTSINRHYLKLKSQLMPYTYSIAAEAVDGLPMIRAMFLDYPNAYTYDTATRYQFLYGPNFLVAPIYQSTRSDEKGNDIRNGIYLPEGTWIDYFSGEKYSGNRIINNFEAPIWKLPVFVKAGAIIPMINANNNPSEIDPHLRIFECYPEGKSSFTLYNDDGKTEAYKHGEGAETLIESILDAKGTANIQVHATQGSFDGMEKMQATEFRINLTSKPDKITAIVGGKRAALLETASLEEFAKAENAYFYHATPNLNQFATKGSAFAELVMAKNPQLLVKIGRIDITETEIKLQIKGYRFEPESQLLASSGTLVPPANVAVTPENKTAYTLMPSWEKVPNADYYEILFQDMLYSTIRENSLLFQDLQAETTYHFQVRAVNKDGQSAWVNLSAETKSDPLEFAIKDIVAEASAAPQGRSGVNRLFDFDNRTNWHTKYRVSAVPFDMTIDLKTVNQLDKMQYVPRDDAGNGTILKGTIQYSRDKQNWSSKEDFIWEKDETVKEITFKNHPSVRYIRIHVSEAVGNYGSGTEMYVFKVPGTESYLQGDINNDRLIDRNDLTSYMNYTGLRRGDSDFEGYISNGDIDKNGLIDAYDISLVATQLDGGVKTSQTDSVAGKLVLSTARSSYSKGETVEIVVKGDKLAAVNALSFALPYDTQDYEFVGVKPLNVGKMENLTYDRLHTDRSKVLYPTFINEGDQETLSGSNELFVIRLKAKRNVKFTLKAAQGILVDKKLGTSRF